MERCIRIEIPTDQLKGFALGDEVTVVSTGIIESLEAGRDPGSDYPPVDRPYRPVSNMSIDVSEQKISKKSNKFEQLVAHEEAEDAEDDAQRTITVKMQGATIGGGNVS